MECWSNGVLGSQHPNTPLLHYSICGPGDRLDPAYYDPEFVENQRFLASLPNAVRLGDLIEFTTYGQVGSREYTESGVRLLTPANLAVSEDGLVTGVDIRSPERFVPEGSRNDPPRSRLRKGDLLLANSGVGCIGRAAVFYSDEPCNISQHINLIRLTRVPLPPAPSLQGRGRNGTPPPLEGGGRGEGDSGYVEPEYVAVYLQTRFGRLQIHREKCGVGACGINFNRIRSILIPILPQEERRDIVTGYRRTAIRQAVRKLEESIHRGSK